MLAGKDLDWLFRGIIVTFFRKAGNDLRGKNAKIMRSLPAFLDMKILNFKELLSLFLCLTIREGDGNNEVGGGTFGA
jgi:hypothetical protein